MPSPATTDDPVAADAPVLIDGAAASDPLFERMQALCLHLNLFDEDVGVSVEWLDGYLTAAALPAEAVTIDALWPLLGDGVLVRAYGDELSAAEPRALLAECLAQIRAQLDPPALIDEPDTLHLTPWLLVLSDADAEQLRAVEGMDADAVALLQRTSGSLWAIGFLQAVDDLAAHWPQLDEDHPDDALILDHLRAIGLLTIDDDAQANDEARDLFAPPQAAGLRSASQVPLDRDTWIDEALFAVQDLRVILLDHMRGPPQRMNAAKVGRNDPCPCGSGRKFKKCHGA